VPSKEALATISSFIATRVQRSEWPVKVDKHLKLRKSLILISCKNCITYQTLTLESNDPVAIFLVVKSIAKPATSLEDGLAST
jgi:hypothetical protein